jgi:hypothetical protein
MVSWTQLSEWLVGGAISLVFGVIGGFVGSWISDYFERRRAREARERRRQEQIREDLLYGVASFARRLEEEDEPVVGGSAEGVLDRKPLRLLLYDFWPFLIGFLVAASMSVAVLVALGFFR